MNRVHKPLGEQVIVITGASSGIGLATARMAAERGARVVLAARDGEALARIRNEIEAAGGRALDVVADVGRRSDVQAIADRAVAEFGGFDTWVNVAGLTIYGYLWEVSDEDAARLLQTNLWGTMYGSLVATEHLRQRGGALINIGSVASDLAFPLQGIYCASKHAVKGFTDALRMELLQVGAPVSVTLIKPTSIDTPLPQRARNYTDAEPKLPPPVYPPEEVANAILHAAVHPQRDIFVGGGGKILSGLKEFAPGAYDLLAPAVTSLQRRNEAPRHPEGALHRPSGDGHAHGSHPGYVMRTSAYTRASLNPLATAGMVAAGVAMTAALMLTGGGRGGRRS
ncbi:SDR family oxidoreductase [Methylobacterium durans]|uniref:SDR family oxidoreductase n=1 Tax=Methylobacterium durans TaxID=2202825 RepID=UPI002AFE8D63|nr:SDR family oxidoreductase [Methylobacterium durans]MEA1832068.1 SDR family oxidoreductase [Methylobacterium durans]